jgi:hypothetical protein
MSAFWMWLIGFYLLNLIISHQFCFTIRVLLIVLCKIGSFWHNWCSLSKVQNQKLNLNFYQMDFWFEFLDIHMNEKGTTCHDCCGLKS